MAPFRVNIAFNLNKESALKKSYSKIIALYN